MNENTETDRVILNLTRGILIDLWSATSPNSPTERLIGQMIKLVEDEMEG